MRVCRLPIDMEVEQTCRSQEPDALMCRRCATSPQTGSVVDVVDVNRRYRTAGCRRVRVGRDTGRFLIGGKKAIAGAKSRPWPIPKQVLCLAGRADRCSQAKNA